MNNNIRKLTITGVKWAAISQVLNQCFAFATLVVLSRILGPEVYGLIGMVTVFTGFATVFGDFGLGDAIVQRKELEPRHLDAAFWTNVAMGTTLTFVMVALAPVVAWFYKEPLLLALTSVIALKFVIDSMYIVHVSLFSKEMRFRTLAGIRIGSTIISGIVGLGLALYGMGPWSLVAQTLGASLMSLAISWTLGNWRPRFSFEIRAFKELFGFSAYVLGFNIINYWARTLDNLLIGRFLGSAALGIYSRAYTLMLMPLNQVSRVVGRVMFPALSAIQDDKLRVKSAYLKSIGVIGLITFPMMIGAFAISDHFILALLGDKWAGVIPVFNIFCWVGLIQSISTTHGWIFLSQGRTSLYFAMGVISAVLAAVGFIIGIRWGFIGVAWSYFIVNLAWWFPSWKVAGRLIDISFSEMLVSLSPIFFCAMAMGAFVWGIGWLFPVGMDHWQYLSIQIPLGAMFYFILVIKLGLSAWHEVYRIFSEMFGDRLKPVMRFFASSSN